MELKHLKQSILDTSLYIEKYFVNCSFKVNHYQLVENFFDNNFSNANFNNICFNLAPKETYLLFDQCSANSHIMQLIHMVSHLDASLLDKEEVEIQTIGHLVKFHFVADYYFSHRSINHYCRDLFWFSLDRIVSNHIKFYSDRKDNSRLVELFFSLSVIQGLIYKKDKLILANLIKNVVGEIKKKNQTTVELSGMITVIHRTISQKRYSDTDYPLAKKKKIKNFLKKQSKIWKKICVKVDQGCDAKDLLPLVLLQLEMYFNNV